MKFNQIRYNKLDILIILLVSFFYYLPINFGLLIYVIVIFVSLIRITIIYDLKSLIFGSLILFLFFYHLYESQDLLDILNGYRFFLGSFLFYIFFRNKIDLNHNLIFYIFVFVTILEAILVNTVISASNMPNFPSIESKHLIIGNGYQRPSSFGSLTSISACLVVMLLFISKDTIFKVFLTGICVFLMSSGTGYAAFLLYFFFKRRKYFIIFSIIVLFLALIDVSIFDSIHKLNPTYISYLIINKYNEIIWFYNYMSIDEILLGSGSYSNQGGGDFKLFAFFRTMGLIFGVLYTYWYFTFFNKRNSAPLIIALVSSIHYGVIFSVPGQLLVGYLLTRDNFNNRKKMS